MLNIVWRALADIADFAWDAAHAGMDDLMWFTIEVAPEPNNYFIFAWRTVMSIRLFPRKSDQHIPTHGAIDRCTPDRYSDMQ